MTLPLEALTTRTIGVALDGLALRHQAIAANIANHATEGYVPVKVDFEAQLAAAVADAHRNRLGTLPSAASAASSPTASSLSGLTPSLQPVLDEQGVPGRVHLDTEVAEMSRNALQFQALARGLSRHFGILAMAASDGRK